MLVIACYKFSKSIPENIYMKNIQIYQLSRKCIEQLKSGRRVILREYQSQKNCMKIADPV
jgi:hypothetical protein